MENNIIKKKTELEADNNILALIEQERKNMKLANHISEEFAKVGLNPLKIKTLFEGLAEPKDIDREEKICFLYSAWDFFKETDKNTLEYIRNINPTLYYYDNLISQVRMMSPKQEEFKKDIIFPITTKLNNKEYQTFAMASELHELKKSGLLTYYKPIQRAYKIERIGGVTVKRENYNVDKLKEITKQYKEKKMLATQITLAVILFDGKIPNISFHPEYKGVVGEFKFIPNLDSNAEDYAIMAINDGNNRMVSAISAYVNSGVDNILSVAIKVINVEEAKDFSAKSFLQVTTDKEYRKTLENNPENRILNTIIEKTNIFNNTIAKTKQERKLDNIIGTYGDMISLIKSSDIDTTNEFKYTIVAERISNCINNLYSVILDNLGSRDNIKENTCLLSKNSALIYLFVAIKMYSASNSDIINVGLKMIQKESCIRDLLKPTKSINLICEKLDKLLFEGDER